MITEKDERITYESRMLKRLRSLVLSEKKYAEHYGEMDDMTIIDLEEWLAEIDVELKKVRN